jgi:phage shock protein PspC (stress-responsive transcriptional regulator)
MAAGMPVPDDTGMTDPNVHPSSPPPASTARPPQLRRRASDRVAAGVATGLADYLNVDPLLIRVGFVGLVLLNGAGFLIYLAAWLLIPVEGRDVSIVEGWVRRLGVSSGTAGTVALLLVAIVAALLFIDWPSPAGPPRIGGAVERAAQTSARYAAFTLALVVIVGGVLLVRRAGPGGPPGGTDRTAVGDPEAGTVGPPPATAFERAARPAPERSPLVLYVLGFLLLALGGLAAIDGGTAAEILPREYAGLALAVLGAGLVVAGWWGRARWLIFVALALVPVGLALSFVSVPLNGDWGSHRAAPASVAELREEYQLAGGRLTIDLTSLPPSTEARHISADIGMGRLVVILPVEARAEITTEVGAGSTDVLDARQQGTGLTDRQVREGTGGGFVLDLEAGIGEVVVRTALAGE